MKRIWYRIVQWIEENLTLARFRLIKEATLSSPYDYNYLLRLEQAKLQEMANYFVKQQDWFDHTNDLKWINICIRLIDIIVDYPEEHPYVNVGNIWRFVNMRNVKPGVNHDKVESYYKKYPQDLRWIKANNLYYEIRKQYTTGWWD